MSWAREKLPFGDFLWVNFPLRISLGIDFELLRRHMTHEMGIIALTFLTLKKVELSG